MGKGHSIRAENEYGKIDIKLNQPYYVVGDTVKGTLEIQLLKEYGVQRLGIKFYGVEIVKIYKDLNKTVLANEEIVLVQPRRDAEVDALIPTVLSIDHHSYPFDFEIKEGGLFPSSTSYKSHALECTALYTLTATLTSYNTYDNDLIMVKEVEVVNKISSYQNKKTLGAGKVNSKNESYGSAKIQAIIDSTAILSSLGSELNIDYDNMDCKKDVKSISVKVHEKISAKGMKAEVNYTEENIIAHWVLEGVKGGEKQFFGRRLIFPETEKIKKLESSTGSHFKREFSMTIEPFYDMWSPCTNKPQVNFNIIITKFSYGRTAKNVQIEQKENNEENKIEMNIMNVQDQIDIPSNALGIQEEEKLNPK